MLELIRIEDQFFHFSIMRDELQLGYYSSSGMPSITSIADNAEDAVFGGYSTTHNMYCRLT